MTDIDYFQLIKWVLIVLAAGFIGQFGKSLATYLIKRARRTKATPESRESGGEPITAANEEVRQEEPSTQGAAPTPAVSGARGAQDKADKKATKALIKMKKKENK